MLPPDSDWPKPPARVSLLSGEVHVWRACLQIDAAEEAHHLKELSPDERQRAAKYRFEAPRRQFISSRSALRSILSHYVRKPANKLVFRLGTLGKPRLHPSGWKPLHFNLSHSRQVALIAVTRCAEIGVDVERVRELASRDNLAKRYFHKSEVAALLGLPAEQRAEAFFSAWTRKEAFLKATGKGISFGIDRVAVTLKPGASPRVLSIDGDAEAASRWTLESLTPASEYIGAVAMEGDWQQIVRFSL